MLLHFTHLPLVPDVVGMVSPLNAFWLGALPRPALLPQMGHLLLVLPLGKTAVSCHHLTLPSERYLLLQPTSHHQPISLNPLRADISKLLVLWISIPFIADMARFLNISDDLQQLLHGVPLLQGDHLSLSARQLVLGVETAVSAHEQETLFLEVVGDVLQLMRLRHQALLRLGHHKQQTVQEMVPLLLQARQFVEARYSERFTTQAVANTVGLSEFHFARLFRAAFDVTLRQYVIQLRLDAARLLLEQEPVRVTDVAYKVGYGSLSTFINAFSQRFGLSPKQYQVWAKASRISQVSI